MRSPLFRSVLLFAVVQMAHAAPPLAAAGITTAPTFTVNSLGPEPAGGDLTNGVCETAPGNGVCTLRAATMKANHYVGGGVTIIVPAGVYYLSSRESMESEAVWNARPTGRTFEMTERLRPSCPHDQTALARRCRCSFAPSLSPTSWKKASGSPPARSADAR